MTDKLDMTTPDGVTQNIEHIAALFPNCVTETAEGKAIDFDLLRQELSRDIVEGPKERYRLEWPGKREAIVTANMPTTNTLRPVREDSVNFDTTENLYIEGDNLEVLKLLQESYLGKVKMIYIDPPYNTGNDFVYNDKFAKQAQESNLESGLIDEEGNRLVANDPMQPNPETAARYHSDWLTMIYPRLKLARNLLTDDGVIAVSIGDNELQNLLSVMSEIFGEKNRICIFTWKSRSKPTNAGNARFRPQKVGEYIVVYGLKPVEEQIFNVVSSKQRTYPHAEIDGRKYRTTTILTSNRGTFRRETMRFEINGYKPDDDYRWKAGEDTIRDYYNNDKIVFNADDYPMLKQYEDEESDPLYPIYCFMDPDLTGTAENGKSDLNAIIGNQHGMDTVKPVQLIKYLTSTFSSPDDIIFDFFSGSATTGQSLIELNAEDGGNRKFIMVQLPEKIDEKSEAYKNGGFNNICEIGKKRLRNAGEKITAIEPPKGGVQSLQFDEEVQKKQVDVGFRVYRLDTSNMQDVYYRPQDYKQEMMDELFANHIKPERTADDLVAQVMLDWGLPLSLPIEQTKIAGKTVYKVDGNALYCCFDDNIDEAFARAVSPFAPLRIVFHDHSFASDTAKENVRQLLKQLSADTEMKVV